MTGGWTRSSRSPLGLGRKTVRIVLAFGLGACTRHVERAPASKQPDARPVDTHAVVAAKAAPGDSCGYVDRTGKVVIPRRFNRAGAFSSGLAAVSENRRVGFIDAKGAYIIPPAFTAAKSFREGVAAACIDGKGWGFIDTHGAWVIPPSYAFADSFSDGVAVVKEDADLAGVCTLDSGPTTVPGEECLAESSGDEPGPYYLVDRAGHRLNAKGYACITRMSEGRAAMLWKNKWGYLDQAGNEVIRPTFGRARPFGQGWAAVWLPNRRDVDDGEGKWGFIEKQGRFKVLARFEAQNVGVFSNGLVGMEGVPVRSLYGNTIGRACLEGRGRTVDELRQSLDEPADCDVYLDRLGKVRIAVPNCGFDDPGREQRSLRAFSGDYAEIVMQEPMSLRPFECAPALMGDVRLFINRQGEFISPVVALASRVPEGLAPSCRASHRAESLDWVY